MLGFVIALEKEAENFLAQINDLEKTSVLDKKAYRGKIDGNEVIIAVCGVGKVNAAFTTQAIIDKYSPTHIINFGTAGGTNDNVKLFNYYLIEKCCQFDFDLSAIDPVPVGYIQDYDTVMFDNYVKNLSILEKTNLASADRFSFNEKDITLINESGCSLRDMEGGAIAQVCTANKIPLIMLKGVTDVYGHETGEFYKNLIKVCNGFSPVVKSIISTL